ncbi:MAG: EAL domain-containing protein, partial [Gemmatimonadota bacterium]
RVCEEAYAALAAWNGDRRPGQELSIWINLSVRQLAEEDVGERLLAMAAAHGVDPAAVTVEVTETGLMRSSEAADRLAAHGFRLAIDDFGTGYASLAFLRLLAVDVLKVDRSFVAGLGQHPTDSAIVETVVTLGRSLEIDVLAEGIESEYQLRRLGELGYRLGQGYLFGRPAPGAEVPELLASSRPGA